MKETKQFFRVLAVANFSLCLGFSTWQPVSDNFAVEELGIQADQIGVIQSVREIPGLMGLVLGLLVI